MRATSSVRSALVADPRPATGTGHKGRLYGVSPCVSDQPFCDSLLDRLFDPGHKVRGYGMTMGNASLW